MNSEQQYQYGDKVVITDEFGKEQVGTIVNTKAWDNEGQFAIDTGSYGVYTRTASEMRLARKEEIEAQDRKRILGE